MTEATSADDPVIIAQGGVQTMHELCDWLRREQFAAALVPPPGGVASG